MVICLLDSAAVVACQTASGKTRATTIGLPSWASRESEVRAIRRLAREWKGAMRDRSLARQAFIDAARNAAR